MPFLLLLLLFLHLASTRCFDGSIRRRHRRNQYLASSSPILRDPPLRPPLPPSSSSLRSFAARAGALASLSSISSPRVGWCSERAWRSDRPFFCSRWWWSFSSFSFSSSSSSSSTCGGPPLFPGKTHQNRSYFLTFHPRDASSSPCLRAPKHQRKKAVWSSRRRPSPRSKALGRKKDDDDEGTVSFCSLKSGAKNITRRRRKQRYKNNTKNR